MTGQGSTFVAVPPAAVWATLFDADALRAVIPGCESVAATGPGAYQVVARIGVGPVRGRFVTEVAFENPVEAESLTVRVSASGPLGSSQGSGHVRFAAQDAGTRVDYDYRVELSGKIASVGGRMLEGASRVLIGAFFEALARQAGGESGGTSGSPSTLWSRILHWLGMSK